ncbi:MAG: Gfo/Idh/MocA family oxidoreductase [Lentisphaeria bacterium]|nr:Gfo/Idh/MocA family oxidoreductase [Lentisphaeria bacterium]
MMSDPVSIVLVGIGGYGGTYCHLLLNDKQSRGKIVGVVDPFAEKAQFFSELKKRKIPFYDTLAEFYTQHTADLAILSTPISLHSRQTCEALEHGSHVLCEKPLCAHPAEAAAMLAAQRKSGLLVAIGYQWSFCSAIQSLKADILDGRLGRPVQFKTLVLWPRTDTYYARNNWAGAMKNADGDWVYDSPANNACAHYLHNMLYLAGSSPEKSVLPVRMQAELYRANPISNYDTAAFRITTQDGPEILFYTTHASSRTLGPIFKYTFEEATVEFSGRGGDIVATFANGQQKNYGNPDQDGVEEKLWGTIRAIRGDGSILCGIEASMKQTLCIYAATLSCPAIRSFPCDLVYKAGVPGNQVRVMTGLAELLEKAYLESTLPAEISNAFWLNPGKSVPVPMTSVIRQ